MSSSISSPSPSSCRVCSHAGSWYEANGSVLSHQLSTWLSKVSHTTTQGQLVKAIISPHAGYSYSGPTAAYGFKHIDPTKITRIFILGPSHHHYTRICELTGHATYATPITPLNIDIPTVRELSKRTDLFTTMKVNVDEDEHSIEMQLPYISHVMQGRNFTIVPILVGALSAAKEREFGELLAPYFQDASTFFVISSDFCHWGRRFQYQPYNRNDGEIWQSIKKLDERGMRLIEQVDVQGFNRYIEETDNSICGKHPIGVLLNILQHLSSLHPTVKFIHYTQSSQCKSMNDSSVSYASAIVTIPAAH